MILEYNLTEKESNELRKDLADKLEIKEADLILLSGTAGSYYKID